MILVYVAALIGLLLILIAGVPYLAYLKNNLYGQYIREEAPETHALKAGTPTTGGLVIATAATMAAALALIMDQNTSFTAVVILATFVLYTFLGLQDDYSKINRKQNKGIGAKSKLLLQTVIAAVPALFVTFSGETSISFFNLGSINLGFLYPVVAIFIIVGASNAVNLTDGLDGLASGTSSIAFFAMAIIFMLMNRADLAIIAAAVGGASLGFLYYNRHPAKMFMGDTGSLALGGMLGTLAVVGKVELWLLLIGIIFIAETLSVIIQVISFKTTGKRVFKMSPIHHHFELSGWSENKVVYTFWSVGLLFASISCVLKYFLN